MFPYSWFAKGQAVNVNDSDEFNEVCCVAGCLYFIVYFIAIFVSYLFKYLLVPKGTGLVPKWTNGSLKMLSKVPSLMFK